MAAWPTVLVVEDDSATREMLMVALRMEGFEVRGAADGLSALRQLEQEVPAVVVLDLDLPCVNGLAIRQELDAQPETRGLPVVVVSGTEWPCQREVYARLHKPVLPEAVVRVVRQALLAPRG